MGYLNNVFYEQVRYLARASRLPLPVDHEYGGHLQLEGWVAGLRETELSVRLPRFELRSNTPLEVPLNIVDHPFLFAIRHRPSGTLLFLGRGVGPVS